jgi:hypothetical protein
MQTPWAAADMHGSRMQRKSEGPHSAKVRSELMCPDERSLACESIGSQAFLGRSFRTKQNRRKTLRKLMAAIESGWSLAYGLEIHLRGNSKF